MKMFDKIFRPSEFQRKSEEAKNDSMYKEEDKNRRERDIARLNKSDESFGEKALVTELGSLLHDEWRAARKKQDGTFEPREKETKDEIWIEKNRTNKVDIANTDYKDLPEDWKGDNELSAEVAIKDDELAVENHKKLDNNFIEEASSDLHDKWLERNKSRAQVDQDKPYLELSEEEKNKDRIIIKKGIEKFNDNEKQKAAYDVAKAMGEGFILNNDLEGSIRAKIIEMNSSADPGLVKDYIQTVGEDANDPYGNFRIFRIVGKYEADERRAYREYVDKVSKKEKEGLEKYTYTK